MNFPFFYKKNKEVQNENVKGVENQDKEIKKLEDKQKKGGKKRKIEILILKNKFVQKIINTNIIEKGNKKYVVINKKEYELTYSIPGAIKELAFFDEDTDSFIDINTIKSIEKGYPSQVIQNYIKNQLEKVVSKEGKSGMQILLDWAPVIIGLVFFLVAFYFASETHVLNCVLNATKNVTTTTTIYPFPFPVVPK